MQLECKAAIHGHKQQWIFYSFGRDMNIVLFLILITLLVCVNEEFHKVQITFIRLAMVSSSPNSLYFGLGLERLWRVIVTRGAMM